MIRKAWRYFCTIVGFHRRWHPATVIDNVRVTWL